MPYVRVREQNAIDATGEFGMCRVKPPCLPRETRRALDEPTLAGNRINDSKADRVAPRCRITPRIFAAIFFATRLRETAVLRGAEYDGKWSIRFRNAKSRRREGRAGEELAARYFHVLFFNGCPLVVRI